MDITELALTPQEKAYTKNLRNFTEDIGFLPLSKLKIEKQKRRQYGQIIDMISKHKSKQGIENIYCNKRNLYLSQDGNNFVCTLSCDGCLSPLLVEIHESTSTLPIYVCERNIELLNKGILLISPQKDTYTGAVESNGSNQFSYFTYRDIKKEIDI